jgi:uncharacterized protein (TIGR02265 family)
MSEIRGLIIQTRMDYLEKTKIQLVHKKVLDKLPESTRFAIGEQIFLTNLYPFRFLNELDQAIDETMEQPSEIIFRDIGNHCAHTILDRYFYNYIESKDPQKFLAQISHLYAKLWNFGTYSLNTFTENDVEVVYSYQEKIHSQYCLYLEAFLKTGVELCGGKNVSIIELDCKGKECFSCRFRLTWE